MRVMKTRTRVTQRIARKSLAQLPLFSLFLVLLHLPVQYAQK